jgi:hypothetical protein
MTASAPRGEQQEQSTWSLVSTQQKSGMAGLPTKGGTPQKPGPTGRSVAPKHERYFKRYTTVV